MNIDAVRILAQSSKTKPVIVGHLAEGAPDGGFVLQIELVPNVI